MPAGATTGGRRNCMRIESNDSRNRDWAGGGGLLTKILVAVALAAAVITAYSVTWHAPTPLDRPVMPLPPPARAAVAPENPQVTARFQREPCNRAAAGDEVLQLIRLNAFSQIVAMFDLVRQKCGTDEELEPYLFSAQMGLADFKGAAATADDLVKRYPADPQSHGWRAQAREKLGDFEGAYADMKKTLDLFPDRGNVHVSVFYDTARLAAAAGHPCEGARILCDFEAMNYTQNRTQQLDTLITGWRETGHCAEPAGPDELVVKYNAKAGGFVAQVTVNGVAGRMLVDTGATETLLTADMARRAHVRLVNDGGATLSTANGVAAFDAGRADRLALGHFSLNNVRVLIQPKQTAKFGGNIDGLLGLSFLGNFQVKLADGFIRIAPR